MEKLYEAHKKDVQGVSHYFVKHFIVFNDVPGLDPVLHGFGMHIHLEQACHIAGLYEESIIERLRCQADGEPILGRVVQMPVHNVQVNMLK